MFHNLLNISGSFLASVIRHKIAPFGINPFVMPKNKSYTRNTKKYQRIIFIPEWIATVELETMISETGRSGVRGPAGTSRLLFTRGVCR